MEICLGNEPALMPVAPNMSGGQSARCYLHGDEADPERLGDQSMPREKTA